ncbi:hypothetical protein CR513_19726, partial [Mucuna pruriens]
MMLQLDLKMIQGLKKLGLHKKIKDNLPNFPKEIDIPNLDDDFYLSISFRRRIKKCTQNSLYHFSNCLSFHKFLPTHKTFLSSLNSKALSY